MADATVLDNPIWHSLNSIQSTLKCRLGLAARYCPEVSRFAALERPAPEAFKDLAALIRPGEVVALFTADQLRVPDDWTVLRARALDQMVCDRIADAGRLRLIELGADDVPEMLALTLATEPGPFSQGTIRMGRYLGIRAEDGRLAAMAGERMKLTGHTEISAVCTDPAFRGRGYAKALVARLAAKALAEGCTPFLHVKTENGAKGLYESLGFRVSRIIHLMVLTR